MIPAGQTGTIGGFEVNCQQHANGTITMQAANSPHSYKCKAKDGREFENGAEYVDGSFVRECRDYGQGKIIGCRVSSEELSSETLRHLGPEHLGDYRHQPECYLWSPHLRLRQGWNELQFQDLQHHPSLDPHPNFRFILRICDFSFLEQ